MPTPRKPRKNCLNCGVECLKPSYIYCSNKCQGLHKQNNLVATGEASPKTWKAVMIRTEGHKCTQCQLETWNSLPIPLELDHIDGNPENNVRENFRLICPNCHAQTATYKGKNAGQGRAYRRERYAEGKSY